LSNPEIGVFRFFRQTKYPLKEEPQRGPEHPRIKLERKKPGVEFERVEPAMTKKVEKQIEKQLPGHYLTAISIAWALVTFLAAWVIERRCRRRQ
jgi:hypothetical protein